MSADARFEDGGGRPLALRAATAADVPVLSALLQEAVLTRAGLRYDRRRRRFGLLVSRLRWEDRPGAERARRPHERVRSLLVIDFVLAARERGMPPRGGDAVLSLLSVGFAPGAGGAGDLTLTFAEHRAVRLALECLDLTLTDVTRPWAARARHAPEHRR